ncbi:MAG: helix-turn-helix domain-containing protein [Patescibacteria group bacterium]
MSRKQKNTTLSIATSPSFGLTRREVLILSYLARVEKERVSTIARVVDLPRTTVHFLLKKLERRTLVQRKQVGKHYEWALSPKNLPSPFADTGVAVFQGLENFKRVYDSISNLPNGSRVFVFQGVISAQSALSHISNKFFSKLHQAIKKRKIITEAVTGEKTLALFETLPTELLESHWGRATIVHVVPDEYAFFDADFFSVQDKLYLLNFSQELAVIISNPAVTHAFHALLGLAVHAGRRVDLNGHIGAILEKRKLNLL